MALVAVTTRVVMRSPASVKNQSRVTITGAKLGAPQQDPKLSKSEQPLAGSGPVSLMMRQAILLALLSGVLFAGRSVLSLRQAFVASLALAVLDLRFAASLPAQRPVAPIPDSLVADPKNEPHERVLWLVADPSPRSALLCEHRLGVFNHLPERLQQIQARHRFD